MKRNTQALLLAFAATLLAGGHGQAQSVRSSLSGKLGQAKAKTLQTGALPADYALKGPLNGTLKASDLLGTATHVSTIGSNKVTTRMYLKPQVADSRQPGSGLSSSEKSASGPAPDGNGMICSTSNVSVRLTDDSFKSAATSGNASKLYPGAVYTFESFFSGRLNPETAPRNPIVVALTNVALKEKAASTTRLPSAGSKDKGGQSWIEVLNPVDYELRDAEMALKNRVDANASGVGSFSADIYMVSSGADTQLKVAGGAAAWGAKVETTFANERKSEESVFLVDATQEMYTVTATPSRNGIFVDPADASKGNKLMMSTVTYGHRVLLSIKTKFDSAQASQAVAASFSNGLYGGKASLQALQSHFGRETQIRMFTVGGATPSFQTLNDKDAMAWLDAHFKATTVKNAKPIKYQFVNMNGDLVRSESATDNYPVRNCVPENVTLHVTLEKIVNKALGNGTTSTRDELVKFGTRQDVSVRVGNQTIWDHRGAPHHSICWWGTDKVPPGCKPVRDFNGSIDVNERREFKLKYSQVKPSDKVKIYTDYIAMYRTRSLGDTNSQRDADTEEIFLDDVLKAPPATGLVKVVEVPFNGRVFQYHYRLALN